MTNFFTEAHKISRVIIAGTSSSSGKTTIACGLLSAFRARGFKVCAYKTGPDYIDTEYLRRAGNCEAHNLDTWLMDEDLTRKLFIRTSYAKDIAIIEGAMGLYDGAPNSTASIAKLLNTPVILVINARSLGESAAAMALGFREYDKNINIAGVILNNTGSDYHVKIISDALRSLGIKFLGSMRRDDDIRIPERHLGLLPVGENCNNSFEYLGSKIEECINLDEIVRISRVVPELYCSDEVPLTRPLSRKKIVAVAHDDAFSFYYPESLEALKNSGARVIFFSPIHDKALPKADSYIFGGGFPEIFAASLSENTSMLESVRHCGKNILAECGGMMYLCRSIRDLQGKTFDMAGLIPFNAFMTDKPVIGYMEARALRDNILCRKGDTVRGHEFHYSRVEPEFHEGTCAFEFVRRRTGDIHYGGYAHENILASYLHVNFFGNAGLAENFLSR